MGPIRKIFLIDPNDKIKKIVSRLILKLGDISELQAFRSLKKATSKYYI